MVLLGEPNVLVLDEPTNDLDTDMLAALEDLLDAWPGTLVVVSHDRYLMERVTDEQFAVVDGGLRHLPGGVDEYVRLSRERRTTSGGVGTFGGQAGKGHTKPSPTLRRSLRKSSRSTAACAWCGASPRSTGRSDGYLTRNSRAPSDGWGRSFSPSATSTRRWPITIKPTMRALRR